MSEDNNSHETASVSRIDEDQNGPPSRRARDGIRGRFGGISRRQFLEVTAGSVVFTGSVSAQESDKFTEEDAKEYWRDVKDANWGYQGTRLDDYHEQFPDELGRNLDITVIDSGFDQNNPLYNPIKDGESFKEHHINVVNGFSISPFGRVGDNINDVGETTEDGTKIKHGTGITGVVWQAAPNANYTIIKRPSLDEGMYPTAITRLGHELRRLDSDVIVTSTELEEGRGPYQAALEFTELANEISTDALFVAAAGNSKEGADEPVHPSLASRAISVSSTKYEDDPADQFISIPYSPKRTRNDKPDIAAPGVGIHTLGPNENIIKASGSSLAAPHVAGIALLLLQHGTIEGVKRAIYDSAVDINDFSTGLAGYGAISIMDALEELETEETDEERDPEDDESEDEEDENTDETGESSITVRLIDAETGEPIPDGTVTLMYFERADDPFGPKSTDDDGVATYDGIDAEHPRRSGEYGVRGRAAGYGEEEERFTLEENRSVEITLELEPEEEVERSTLTVSVVDAETGDPVGTLPNVYVDHDGERIETARTNDRGRARISLEDGREYTVSAVDNTGASSEERTVTLDGDTEITLELNGEENTKTVWVPDPDSDSCSRMTVPADAHPDPAFETEEACLEYNGGFGGGNEDTAEETPSEN